MKAFKLFFALFVILFSLQKSFSQIITKDEAEKYAINVFSEISETSDLNNISFTEGMTVQKEEGNPAMYIFNVTNGGFVIISAETKAFPVLAFSTENNIPIDEEKWNISFNEWVDLYCEQINLLRKENNNPEKEISEKWKQLKNGEKLDIKGSKDVTPLLSTTWNQGCGYNSLCPSAAGGPCGRVYTGCVATAMAQVIRYQEYPTSGIGSQCYYTYNYGELCADFSSATYDYSSMSSGSGNAEVAELMYHCGVSVFMNYSPSGSGAYSHNVVTALKNFFDYKNVVMISKGSYAINDWNRILRNEIDNFRPFYCAGFTASSGHAFVLDGYQGADFFHINWGWGGSSNGFFYLNAITYSNGQEVIIGTIPSDDFTNLDVSSAVSLNCSTPVSGNISTGTDYINYYKNSYPATVGKELVYTFITTLPGRIRIKITNNVGGDVNTFLLSHPHQDSLLMYSQNGLIIEDTEPGIYYVAVEGVSGVEPNFDIEVICPTIDADLIISYSDVSPHFIESLLNNVNFSSSVKNIGNTSAGTCEIEYYLSSDNAYDGSDILLGNDIVPAINIGESMNIYSSLSMPAGLISGNYYIIFNLDRDNVVIEADNDNYSISNVTVPDIGIMNCSASLNLQNGIWLFGNTQIDGNSNLINYWSANNMTGPEVIHSFTPEYDGFANVTFIEKSAGTLTAMVLPICNENTYLSNVWLSSITDTIGYTQFYASAGTEYFIIVDGSLGAFGDYGLKVDFPHECPVVELDISGDTLLCDGDAYPSMWTSWGGSNYQWFKNGLEIPAETSSWYSPNSVGIYHLEITENGCAGISESVNIQMSFRPDTANITSIGNLEFCVGESVELQLENTVSYPYNWALNGIPISGATSDNYIAEEAGTYTLITTNGACSIPSDNSIDVETTELPVNIGELLPIPSENLDFYYTFEKDNSDLSGNNYIFNCWNFEPVNDRFNNFWKARYFTDNDVFGYSSHYEAIPSVFTMSYWFRTTTTQGGLISGFVNNPWSVTQNDAVVYMSDDGKINFFFTNGSTPVELNSIQSYNDGEWHCITIQHNSGISMDIDNGGEFLQILTAVTNLSFSGYWIFGGPAIPSNVTNLPTSGYFDGCIDDIISVNEENPNIKNYNNNLPHLDSHILTDTDNCTSANVDFEIVNSQQDVEYQVWNINQSEWFSLPFQGNLGNIVISGLETINETTEFQIYATDINTNCQRIFDSIFTVNVFPVETPSLTVLSDVEDTICSGTSVNFTAFALNSGTNPEFEWFVNDENQLLNSNLFSNDFETGTYEIFSKVYTDNICATSDFAISDTIILEVLEYYTPDISIIDNTVYPLCEGSEALFSLVSENPGSNPVYQWYVNDELVGSNSTEYSYIPENIDQIYIMLTSDLECTTVNPVSSNVVVMTVNAQLTVSINIEVSENPIISGTEVTFTALPTNEGDNPEYKWYVNNIYSGTDNSEFSYIPLNGDEIFSILTSDEICTLNNPANSDTITMIVNPVSISELINSNSYKVYPNPAKDFVYFESDKIIEQIQISDVSGKIIYQKNIGKKDFKLDISKWSNSFYSYKIIGSKEVFTGNLIILE